MASLMDVDTSIHSGYRINLSGDIINVSVGRGEDPKVFIVHESIICPRSEFFTQAMNREWEEGEVKAIAFPDDDPAIFDIYLQLVYTDQLSFEGHCTIFDVDKKYMSMCKLYVLAERLVDFTTKNRMIAAILGQCRNSIEDVTYYLNGRCVQIIYDGTPPDSPARKLIVDLYCDFGTLELNIGPWYILPKDFLCDLCLSMMQKRPYPEERITETCEASDYFQYP